MKKIRKTPKVLQVAEFIQIEGKLYSFYFIFLILYANGTSNKIYLNQCVSLNKYTDKFEFDIKNN